MLRLAPFGAALLLLALPSPAHSGPVWAGVGESQFYADGELRCAGDRAYAALADRGDHYRFVLVEGPPSIALNALCNLPVHGEWILLAEHGSPAAGFSITRTSPDLEEHLQIGPIGLSTEVRWEQRYAWNFHRTVQATFTFAG